MASAAELAVVVGADIDGAMRGLRTINRTVNSTGGFFKTAAASAVGFAGATIGLAAAAAAPQALADAFGLGLAIELENAEAALTAFTKDGAQSAAILATLRKEADQTPFGFRELTSAATSLLPAAKATGKELMDLIKVAEVLAALNPAEGLDGAAFSLREALSGDFVSVVERFNLSRDSINRMKKEGVPALEIIRRALAEMGADQELVARRSQTFSGRLSTFQDALDSIRIEAGKPILGALSEELLRFTGILSGSQGNLAAAAASIGTGIAGGIRQAGESLGIILVTAQNIAGEHGLGLVQAALIATELRIREVFGQGGGDFFHGFLTAVQGIPGLLAAVIGFITTEFPKAIKTLQEAGASIEATFKGIFAQVRQDFALFVTSLATLPGPLGESFKDAARQMRGDAGLVPMPIPAAGGRAGTSGLPAGITVPPVDWDTIANPKVGTAAGAEVTQNIEIGDITITDKATADYFLGQLADLETQALEAAGVAALPGAE